MDDYPEHLAPEFDEGGAPATPFEDWWARVQDCFPTVPEDVARYWLYEHWRHSPFSFLRSRDYAFEAQDWAPDRVREIKSRWCDYDERHEGCRAQGEYILKLSGYRTRTHMLAHGVPPARLIVLDNWDSHLVEGRGRVPEYENLPTGYVLIEGHRRFNMCLALHARDQLKLLPIWLMKRVASL